MAERLSELERWRIAELAAQGWTTRLIAKEIGRGHCAVAKHLRVMRRPPARERVRSPLRLSLSEREEISRVWRVASRCGRSRDVWVGRRRRSRVRLPRMEAGAGIGRAGRTRRRCRRMRRPKPSKLADV